MGFFALVELVGADGSKLQMLFYYLANFYLEELKSVKPRVVSQRKQAATGSQHPNGLRGK